MLKTGTVGYHDVVDVYFDTLFNSFAFAHPQPVLTEGGAAIFGTALSSSGAPLANRPVKVTFADGQTRTVVTNAQGVYRVVDAPLGQAKIDTGLESSFVVVEPGKEATVTLRFPE
jgi:hypothetical protein